MSEIIKVCKKHGDLTRDQIHPKGKSPSGKQYYGCILCKRIAEKVYSKTHQEKLKEMNYNRHQRRKLNPEWKKKKNEQAKSYFKRRREERGDELRAKQLIHKRNYYSRNHENILIRQRNNIKELKTSYLRYFLKRHHGFENPSDDLIYAKQAIMRIKREIMAINCNMGKNKYVKKTRKYQRGYKRENGEGDIYET